MSEQPADIGNISTERFNALTEGTEPILTGYITDAGDAAIHYKFEGKVTPLVAVETIINLAVGAVVAAGLSIEGKTNIPAEMIIAKIGEEIFPLLKEIRKGTKGDKHG